MADAAEQQYEQEQGALRQRHGYTQQPDEDLHIEAPQRPEVNPEVYKDVEPLLFRGFLHLAARVNEVSFVFKSLNNHEFDRLNLLSQHGTRDFFNLFLAFGVFMVDGVNILPERDKWIPELAKLFEDLGDSVRQKVVRYLGEINRRANRAVFLSEVYSLEGSSRLRWAQFQGLDLTQPAVTGIAGTEHLGMNWGQLTWRAINYLEDRRATSEQEWENAKFIASAMAGSKGMSQVNARDRQRREQEEKARYDRRDKVLRMAVLGEKETKDAKRGAPVKAARTVEELADQLEKDLRGEKDFHDLVVEAHERRLREAREQQQRQLDKFRVAHVKKYGDKPIIGGVETFQGLTPAQVEERVRKRRAQTLKRLTEARDAHPELFDPKLAQFHDKWASAQPPSLDADPREVAPMGLNDKPRVLPFKRGDS